MLLVKPRKATSAIFYVAVVALLITSLILSQASAGELKTRTISVSKSTVGEVSDYQVSFLVPNTQVLGSISFEFCSNSPIHGMPCTPAGVGPVFDHDNNNLTPDVLNVSSGIILSNQQGNVGFSASQADTTSTKIVIKRSAVSANNTMSSYTLRNMVNPSTPNKTVFVRIATYISEDGTGMPSDIGGVAYTTTSAFRVDAYVPPFLIFCAAVTVSLNCNNSSGYYINIGELRSSSANTATMQFSGATNDSSGFNTFLNGYTLTSGNNIIEPLESPGTSKTGSAQFGLNLRSNNAPSVGAEPVGPGSSSPVSGYGSSNVYKFVNGDLITKSNTSTDFKVFTASFIINVTKDQKPGYYATTMTFTAIASF